MTGAINTLTLTDRALVRVSGPDSRGFLQGLLTQDVEGLEAGALRYGALLTPQGRLLVDVFLLGTEDGVVIDVDAGRRDDLIRRLTLYRLRAKAQIVADDGAVEVCIGAAPEGEGWMADPRLAAMGWRRYGASDPATDGDREAWDAHRIALAVPGMADFGDEATYPLEVNLDLLNGIDFKKGCFVGQETTSRMKRRGVIKSRLLPIAVEGAAPAAGTEVLKGELRAGSTLSAVDGMALAVMRLDRLDGELTVDGRPARPATPDWLTSALGQGTGAV